MRIDELPGCEYYLMLLYGGEFLHLFMFSRKERREKKEKPRKTITTALPKETADYFGLLVKRLEISN